MFVSRLLIGPHTPRVVVVGLHIFVSLQRKEEVVGTSESPGFLNVIVCSLYMLSWLLLTFAFSDDAASAPPSTIKRRGVFATNQSDYVFKVG